jgi:hypothetical protein
VIRWFLSLLVILLLLRLVLRFVFGLLQGLASPSETDGASSKGARTRGRAVGTSTLVRDPVCGTYIPREGAVTAIVRGETRHYCSDTCRAKDAEAARFNPVGRAAHG